MPFNDLSHFPLIFNMLLRFAQDHCANIELLHRNAIDRSNKQINSTMLKCDLKIVHNAGVNKWEKSDFMANFPHYHK